MHLYFSAEIFKEFLSLKATKKYVNLKIKNKSIDYWLIDIILHKKRIGIYFFFFSSKHIVQFKKKTAVFICFSFFFFIFQNGILG